MRCQVEQPTAACQKWSPSSRTTVQPNGVKVATEGQARGRFGGDVDALTAAHAQGGDEVQAALDMPADADACTTCPTTSSAL